MGKATVLEPHGSRNGGDLDNDYDDGDGDPRAARQSGAGLLPSPSLRATRRRQFGHYQDTHPVALSPSSTSIGRTRAPPAYDQMLPPSSGEVDSMSDLYDQASEAAVARGRSVGGSVASFGLVDEGWERGRLRYRRTMTPDGSVESLQSTSLRQRRRGGGNANPYPGCAEAQDEHHHDNNDGGAEGGGRCHATIPRESGSRSGLSSIRPVSSSPEGEGDGEHDGIMSLGNSSMKLSSIRPVNSSPEYGFDVDYRPWQAEEGHDRDGFSSGGYDGGYGRHAGSRRRRGRRSHADEDHVIM